VYFLAMEQKPVVSYSFIVPIYNDGHLAKTFCNEFLAVFQKYLGPEDIRSHVELIFVNDGSPNDSFNHLKALPADYPFVKVISLSRNFGQHIALSCGYKHAKGDYVGSLNVDMQDPPYDIPALLNALKEQDADIAIGIRKVNIHPFFHKITSYAFYWTLNKLTGFDAPLNAATLRVMNRRFTDAYNALSEKTRYIPGLELWLGFKHIYVPVDHTERREGKSSYTFLKRLRFAVDSILAFSDRPLKMATVAGFTVATIGILMGAVLVLQKLMGLKFQPGYSSTISLMLFLGGCQIFLTGLCGLYIGRTLIEAQNRPLYLIRDTVNL
jgi:glycosyltransferase involved in cell wall biosynthesis